jgi:hypothetical protein
MTRDLKAELLGRYGGPEQCLRHLERSRREVLSLAQTLSETQLFLRPDPETWSPAEVLEHVAAVEEGAGKVIRRLLKVMRGEAEPYPELPQSRFRGDGRLLAPPETEPRGGLSRTELGARLEAVRSRLLAEVGGNEAALSQTSLYRHPFWGELTALGWLQTLVYHERHHLRQIQQRLGILP